jgi:hypothetical protein
MIEIKRIDLDLFKSRNLTFRDDGLIHPGAKTRQFSVFNTSNRALLGYIKWFAFWRQYCFYPLNSVFDNQCLEQVALFMKETTAAHKSRLPNIKRGRDMMKARRQRRIEQLAAQKESLKKDLTLEQASATMVSVSEGPTSDVVGLVEGISNWDAPEERSV